MGMRLGRGYIPTHGLPLSYYENAIQSVEYDKLHICTDRPNDPMVKYIKNKYNATIRALGVIDNLNFIKKFNNIIISNSTFLWWAAFLSNAEVIVFPRPENGFWSRNEPISKNIDLGVHEDRYKYLNCEKYESEFYSEIISIFFTKIIAKSRRIVRKFIPQNFRLDSVIKIVNSSFQRIIGWRS